MGANNQASNQSIGWHRDKRGGYATMTTGRRGTGDSGDKDEEELREISDGRVRDVEWWRGGGECDTGEMGVEWWRLGGDEKREEDKEYLKVLKRDEIDKELTLGVSYSKH